MEKKKDLYQEYYIDKYGKKHIIKNIGNIDGPMKLTGRKKYRLQK